MAAVTLAQLISRSRNRANMERSSFVSDSELTDYINEAAMRLHELVAAAYGNEYVKSVSSGNTVAGTSDYALPSDFFKLTGVDMTFNGKVRSLKKYMETERNTYKNMATTSWLSIPRYKLDNSNIRFLPAPNSALAYSIIYIPLLQVTAAGPTIVNKFTYTNTSDTVNFPNGWEKFITLYAAIECLDKEESETRHLKQKLATWEAELKQIADNRDAGQPMHTTDVECEDVDPRWW